MQYFGEQKLFGLILNPIRNYNGEILEFTVILSFLFYMRICQANLFELNKMCLNHSDTNRTPLVF